MVLTLATDYSELRGVLAFPGAVLMYLCLLWVALAVSRVHRGPAWMVAIIWGVVFPVIQAALAANVSRSHGLWLSVAATSAISAWVLGWVTRSWLPVAGCVVGYVATGLTGKYLTDADLEVLLAVPWNVCVGGSLVLWAVLARRAIRPEWHCEKCGYDLRGTVGRVCPECGTVGVDGAEKPAR